MLFYIQCFLCFLSSAVGIVWVGFFVLVFSFITLDDMMNSEGWKEPLLFRLTRGERPSVKRDYNMCPCAGGECCSRENESRYSLNETLMLSLLSSLSGEKNYLKEKHCNAVLIVQAFKVFMIWSTLRYQISQFSNPLKQHIKLVQIQVTVVQF